MAEFVVWYLVVQCVALAGWLIARPWLRHLGDGAYALAKPLGLLLCGYTYWVLVTLGMSQNGVGAALLALLIIVVAGALWHGAQQSGVIGIALSAPRATPVIRVQFRPAIVATEIVFFVAYLAGAVYRAYNPNIESAGGEKYMEIMMLNAILRSETFPPNDAWLSGYSISYYYFGFVQYAFLTLLSRVPSSIAFNLAGATTFALTTTAGFGLGHSLWQAFAKNDSTAADKFRAARLPVLAGVLTAVMVACMGNQGGLVETLRCSGVLPREALSALDVRNSVDANPAQFRDGCIGVRPNRFYWWWTWSRVVSDRLPSGQNLEAITEFPAFSFVLGDVHPHVMNLPMVLLAVGIGLQMLLARASIGSRLPRLREENGALTISAIPEYVLGLARNAFYDPHQVLLAAICIGGLSFMNTWDFPVFGGLAVGGLVLGAWLRREPLQTPIVRAGIILLLSYALYWPWYATFASQARGIAPNLFNATPLHQLALQFGPFLIAVPTFLLLLARQNGVARTEVTRTVLLAIAGLIATLALAAALAFLSPQVRGLWSDLANGGSVFGVNRSLALQGIAARANPLNLLTPVFLLLMIALGVRLLVALRNKTASPALSFLTLLAIGGLGIVLAPEFMFLLDNFGTRMNTVFKFWFIGWVLFAIVSAFATTWLIAHRSRVSWLALPILLFMLTGTLYPMYAALSRTNGFAGPATLDGLLYIERFQADDYKAIRWLQTNVPGDAVILEAPGDKGKSYDYVGRFSAFTGLPSTLGWAGHQSQWRGNYDLAGRREVDVDLLFTTTELSTARAQIRRLKVDYVILGSAEVTRYQEPMLAKFASLGKQVFRSGGTVIYKLS